MNEQEKLYGLALAALAGLVARGATPAEVRDTLWQYAEFALTGEPQNEQP